MLHFPRCVPILPQARGYFCSGLLFVLHDVPTRLFAFVSCLAFFFVFFLSFLKSHFNVSGFLACVCCACRIRHDGMAFYCLLITATQCSISVAIL